LGNEVKDNSPKDFYIVNEIGAGHGAKNPASYMMMMMMKYDILYRFLD
jgi:hypothetical protein